MTINTADANRNGLSRTDNSRPQEAGLEWHQGRQSVGDKPAHAGIVGAGQTPPIGAGAPEAEGNPLGGALLTDATGEPAFSALFDTLLADHQAEEEYAAFLAEVEAEALNRDQEEDSEYWAAHLDAHRANPGFGMGVAA